MSLPALRFQVGAPFPSLVQGTSFIEVEKVSGVWRIKVNYELLGAPIPVTDPTGKVVVVFDLATKLYNLTTVATLIGVAIGSYREHTVAGDIVIAAGDITVLANKAVGAATNVILPPSASRGGVPVTVKDYRGDAAANNIRFVMDGAETLDQFNQATADANGSSLIDINKGKKTLYPLTAGGWYL